MAAARKQGTEVGVGNMITTRMYENGVYLDRNPSWHEEDSPWKASHVTSILKSNNVRPTSVSEVGCGAGEVLKCLAREYGDAVQFTGYDISPQAYSICRHKQTGNLRFLHRDLLTENVEPVDVLLAMDVIEHVEDYFGFLRALRSKAIHKVFHIPLDLSVQSVFRSTPILRHRASVGHIQYFTKETALATLTDTGYEILDYRYTASALELPHLGWKARLMKWPRRCFYRMHRDLAVRVLGGFSLLVLAR